MKRLLTAVTILCLLSFGFVWAQDPEGELDYFYIVCGVNGYPGSGVSEVCFKLRFYSDNYVYDNTLNVLSAPIIITGSNIVAVDTTFAKAWAGSAVSDFGIITGPYKPENSDPTVPPFHMVYSAVSISSNTVTGDSLFVNVCLTVNDTGTICIDTMSTETVSPHFQTPGNSYYLAGWAGPFCCQVVLCQERAGDANNDGMLSVADIIYNVNHVFKGGPAPSIFCQGNVNADSKINLTDIIYEVTYLFKGGPAPLDSDLCCL